MEPDKQDAKSEEGFEGKIHAVAELVKAVPIYQDAIRPLAKEAGKALELVGRTVNAALAPIRGAVWGIEQIEAFVTVKVSERLKDVPIGEIVTPDLSVAGPVLESLRFAGHKEKLCEMYANLLAASMTNSVASSAHPGFVEIIRNLCSDEAKLLSYIWRESKVAFIDVRRIKVVDQSFRVFLEFVSTAADNAGCEDIESTPAYVTNLQRLGLVFIDKTYRLAGDAYNEILEDEGFKENLKANNDAEHITETLKYVVEISPLGAQFCKICVG